MKTVGYLLKGVKKSSTSETVETKSKETEIKKDGKK